MAHVINNASTLPRRGFLSGLAALPLAGVPVAAAATVMPDPVYDAIEKHKAAWLDFREASAKVVNIVRIPADLEEMQEIAADAETEARYAMHAAVPQTIQGLVAYVSYWNAFCETPPRCKFGQLDEIGWEAIPTIAEAVAMLFPKGGAA